MSAGWMAAGVMALVLSGCAAFRSYDAELYPALEQASGGNVEGAIRLLESNNRLPDKDLLYYMELGMLQRLGSRYDESQKAWMAAEARMAASSGDAFAMLANLASSASSYLLNDKLRAYQGYDYERVMLLTYMALNHLARGDYENARVAIRQTHEFEAQIAELRAKQYAEVEEEASKRGARTSVRELSGYPVETIDNPAVNALRNSYQSALSHYLAGFVYEALGEASLAAPGYRLANELQPGRPLLEEALRGLDERMAAADDGMTDVLFIIGTGTAPAVQSRQFVLPVWVQGRFLVLPHAFPVITTTSAPVSPRHVALEGKVLPAEAITSVDAMARRRLKDDMPAIMLRATVRTTTAAVLQYQTQRLGDRQSLATALASAAVTIGSAAFASADDRTWRALPSDIFIARGRVARGVHTVTLDTSAGPRSARVEVAGRYAVVDFRLLRQQIFVNAPKAPSAAGGGPRP
ncbi:MAG TPA: hypothetical protein VJ797_13750 [Burkholderiales bacterium]|nr:hypothetical protein [Burkholderiales bacterium]